MIRILIFSLDTIRILSIMPPQSKNPLEGTGMKPLLKPNDKAGWENCALTPQFHPLVTRQASSTKRKEACFSLLKRIFTTVPSYMRVCFVYPFIYFVKDYFKK